MRGKRILILEDNPSRHKAFRQKFIGNTVVIVSEPREAKLLLEDMGWDVLCLDHDLGGQEMMESGSGTGYEVAEWSEKHPARQPKTIIIHSLNPVGSANMNDALPDAHIIPRAWKAETSFDIAECGCLVNHCGICGARYCDHQDCQCRERNLR